MFNSSECGPSNPLQKITKAGLRDKSVQQDTFQRPEEKSFRNVGNEGSRMQQEFNEFVANGKQASGWSDIVGHDQFGQQQQHQYHQSIQHHQPLQHQQSLQLQQQHQQPLQRTDGDWARDFSALSLQQPLSGETQGFVPRFTQPAPSFQVRQQQPQQSTPHSQDAMNAMFDKAFQQVEQEINNVEPPKEKAELKNELKPDLNEPNDDLAKIARHIVVNIDKSNAKLENSKFMALMSQLSEGTVMLQNEQFVDKATGEEIQSGPNSQLKSQSGVEPRTETQSQNTSRLPDPLSFLDTVEGPFESAHQITGVGKGSWEEKW